MSNREPMDFEAGCEAVVRLIRLVAVWASGRLAVPTPSAHDLDEGALREILTRLREREAGPLARVGESRPGRPRNIPYRSDLRRIQVRGQLADVLEHADAREMLPLLGRVFSRFGVPVSPRDLERTLRKGARGAATPSGIIDASAAPIAEVIAAFVTVRGGRLSAADHLLDEMLGPDDRKAMGIRSARAAQATAGLLEKHEPLGAVVLEALGRGAALGMAVPLTFLLRDVLGYPADRVQEAVRVLEPARCVVELPDGPVHPLVQQALDRRREALPDEALARTDGPADRDA